MAMTAAELVAYLRLDDRGFTKGMQQAEKTMAASDGNFRKFAKGMGNAAAGAITGGAAAATALGTSVFKTGVEYNTLQQSSRAALKTIMGGGAQANAQMDKLDSFAKNSPFSKAVFIKAQQQLLGFGMTAKDVVPTLDAIQNAVAATGGSNEDIAEISTVLAQVTGTGKITAETLNQLGYRGINAADIIGKEMGKSGNEIRASITKGTLDAGKAMDALTSGMQKRFGGAAANVKQTMSGAADRIKAAFRDVGSKLAAPFVDPNGGGLAITWFNQFADVIRAVEGKTKPFVDMMMSRFSPAFQHVSAALLDAKDAINRFDLRDLEKALDGVAKYAPAIAAVSGALLNMGLSNIPVIGGLAKALGPIPTALLAAASASPEMRAALGDLMEALEPLVPVLVDLAKDTMGIFTTSVEGAADVLEAIVGVVKPAAEAFNGLPDPVKKTTIAVGAFIALQKMFPNFTTSFGQMGSGVLGHLKGMGDKIAAVPGAFANWKGAVSGATGSLGDFRAATSLTVGAIGKGAAKGLMGAASGLVSFLGGPWGIALGAAGIALTMWAQKQQEAKQRTEEFKGTLDETTGKLTDATWGQITENLSKVNSGFAAWWAKTDGKSAIDFANELGVSMDDMKGYILGTKDGVKALTKDMNASKASSKGNLVAYQELIKTLDEQKGSLSKAQKEQLAKIEADKALVASNDEAARSIDRMNTAIKTAADSTQDMTSRTKALKDALDELNGETKSTEEASRDLDASTRTMVQWLNAGEKQTKGFAQAIKISKDGVIEHSEAGDQLNAYLQDYQDKSRAAALAAYDKAGGDDNAAVAAKAAAAAYRKQTKDLRKNLEGTKLSKGQIDALIGSMDGVPDDIRFTLSSGGTITKADKAIRELQKSIRKTPNAKKIIIHDNSKETKDALKALGLKVKELPDGTISVSPNKGSFADVKKLVDNAVRDREISVSMRMIGNTKDFANSAVSNATNIFKKAMKGKHDGGIDVHGMAAGGVTGSSMSVAQMVKPGDIRFAGDRSDVDEAWIPLDGSKRSWKILTEALRRMPGGAEGMAKGGVTGKSKGPTSQTKPVTTTGTGVTASVTPPKLEGVDAPETATLTDTWADAMTRMLTDTEVAFQTIQKDTASGTTAATASTKSGQAAQTAATTSGTAARTAATKASNHARTASTRAADAQQVASTRTAMTNMDKQVSTSLSHMRSTTSVMWHTMASTASKSSAAMRSNTHGQFTALARELEATRSGPMASTFSALSNTMRHQMPAAFRAGKESSAAAFAGLGPAAKSPVEYIINTVYNSGIRGVWNKVANEFDKKHTLPEYRPKGFYTGGYTGDGGKYQKAGDVHAGEYVFRQEATTKLRKTYGLKGLDHINRTGELPGYASGGLVKPLHGWQTDFHNFGEARAGGRHLGDDLAVGMRSPVYATADGKVAKTGWNIVTGRTGIGVFLNHAGNHHSYYGHLTKALVEAGQRVKAGQEIALSGSTGNSSGPHLHFEWWNGGNYWKSPVNPASILYGGSMPKGGNTGVGGDLGVGFIDPEVYTKPLDALKKKLGGAGSGPWASMAQGVGTKMIDTMTSWITDNVDSAGGSMAGPDGSGVSRWRGQVKKALAANGLPTTAAYINAWLRQINTESGGNPKAVQGIHDINSAMGLGAKGLLQTIPPTFAAFAFPGHQDIFNGYDNMLAAMRYAKNRYGKNMLATIGHGHGYARGTSNAAPGYHWVGEQGPELLKFKGGETVRNNNRSRTMAAAASKLTRQDAKLIAAELARAVPTGGDRYTIHAERESGAREIADAISFKTLQTRRR